LSRNSVIMLVDGTPLCRSVCRRTAAAEMTISRTISTIRIQVIIVPAFTGKRSICRSKKGSTCFINTKPKTPHITAKERLVRPLRFKGSLLYSQETVPKAISCTQEQTYSNKAPTTALTKKMMKLLECLNRYITKVKSTAPKP